MKAYSSVRIGARSTIFKVTFDRTSEIGQLAAYLMVAACQELQLDKMVTVRPSYLPVIQSGKLCILSRGSRTAHIRLVLLLVTPEHILKPAFLWLRSIAYKRPVELVHIRLAEHGIESFKGLGCLRKDGDAAYGPVKTMGQAHEHLSRLGIALSYESLVFLAERLVPGLVTLNDFPHLLVHYQKVIVFI